MRSGGKQPISGNISKPHLKTAPTSPSFTLFWSLKNSEQGGGHCRTTAFRVGTAWGDINSKIIFLGRWKDEIDTSRTTWSADSSATTLTTSAAPPPKNIANGSCATPLHVRRFDRGRRSVGMPIPHRLLLSQHARMKSPRPNGSLRWKHTGKYK